MKYELFTRLYGEALEHNDVEIYIAERGWQDWMDDHDSVGSTLKSIYLLANSTLKESRDRLNISRAEFSRRYYIPVRTLENWDAGINEAPEYVKMLLDYTILIEEENNMKNKLTVANLNASHYDNGLHELEFKVGGQTVFVRNIDVDVNEDEFYWDDEENVKKAVDEASDDDIEVEELKMEITKDYIENLGDYTLYFVSEDTDYVTAFIEFHDNVHRKSRETLVEKSDWQAILESIKEIDNAEDSGAADDVKQYIDNLLF